MNFKHLYTYTHQYEHSHTDFFLKHYLFLQRKFFARCCTYTFLTNPQDSRFRQRKQRGNKNEIREKGKVELPLSQAFVIRIA